MYYIILYNIVYYTQHAGRRLEAARVHCIMHCTTSQYRLSAPPLDAGAGAPARPRDLRGVSKGRPFPRLTRFTAPRSMRERPQLLSCG